METSAEPGAETTQRAWKDRSPKNLLNLLRKAAEAKELGTAARSGIRLWKALDALQKRL
jgi:hypothetical protein